MRRNNMFPRFFLMGIFGFGFLFYPSHLLKAQETVDTRSGRLVVTVTDLIVAAGPINLEVKRTLVPEKKEPGLLGARWRLNIEKRLVKEKKQVRIEAENGSIVFTQEGGGDYRNGLGEWIRLEKNGRAIYAKRDGTREIYNSDGRLSEVDYRNYNRVSLTYVSNSRLSRIEGPRKTFLKLDTDPQGRLIRIESSNGDQITYQYSGENLSQVLKKRSSWFSGVCLSIKIWEGPLFSSRMDSISL